MTWNELKRAVEKELRAQNQTGDVIVWVDTPIHGSTHRDDLEVIYWEDDFLVETSGLKIRQNIE